VYIFALSGAVSLLSGPNDQARHLCTSYFDLIQHFQPNIRLPVALQRSYLSVFNAILGLEHKDPVLTRRLFCYTTTLFADERIFEDASIVFESGCMNNAVDLYEDIAQIMDFGMGYLDRERIVRGFVWVACA
jgi:hypothetical protein